MATPPRARKMAPERPFPVLIETGKSYSKTGLLPAVFRRFSDSFLGKFDAGFPAVFQPFSGGSTAVLPTGLPVVSGSFPAVRRQFSSGFPTVLPTVFRPFSAGFPAAQQRFCQWSPEVFQRFPGGFPAVVRRFSCGFPAVSRRFSSGFLGKFDGGWTTVFRQHASPGSTPSRLRHPPSSERNCRQFRTQFQAYKPSIAAFRKCVCDKETCQTGGNE